MSMLRAPLTDLARRTAQLRGGTSLLPLHLAGRATTFSLLAPFARPPAPVLTNRPPWSRTLHTTRPTFHGSMERPAPGTGIEVKFVDSKDQEIKTVETNQGDDLLTVAHEYDIDLEGACEGSIACSTCHVILQPEVFDQLEEPGDDENDMLDLAFGLTDTSRLGCQVQVRKELEGMVVKLPSATRNMYVDGARAGHGN